MSKIDKDSMIVNHLSTRDEIEKFAFDGNHTILHRCIFGYRCGKYTWEQAMQIAAVTQAESLATLSKEFAQFINRQAGPITVFGGKGMDEAT